ncbi:hypothetical protein ABEB36_014038 [Hypothenemus hampei]|uniref:Uncharacterized protein n=1 Tax=Hypothenemus hampei TaxID=57062 RepID=A0ABD1E341_HYPHA
MESLPRGEKLLILDNNENVTSEGLSTSNNENLNLLEGTGDLLNILNSSGVFQSSNNLSLEQNVAIEFVDIQAPSIISTLQPLNINTGDSSYFDLGKGIVIESVNEAERSLNFNFPNTSMLEPLVTDSENDNVENEMFKKNESLTKVGEKRKRARYIKSKEEKVNFKREKTIKRHQVKDPCNCKSKCMKNFTPELRATKKKVMKSEKCESFKLNDEHNKDNLDPTCEKCEI